MLVAHAGEKRSVCCAWNGRKGACRSRLSTQSNAAATDTVSALRDSIGEYHVQEKNILQKNYRERYKACPGGTTGRSLT
eukprot:scaffold101893_cov21-Phaeocystis_antarctica.AAC.1